MLLSSNVDLLNFAAQTGEVMLMPVPSSWNDITQNDSLKEYIGWVWYEREAWVPSLWAGLRIVLRFESAHYNAIAVSIRSYCTSLCSIVMWGCGWFLYQCCVSVLMVH